MVDAAAFWRERPVLLTGAAGYLGRALAGQLGERGARVIGFDRVDPGPIPGIARLLTGDLGDTGRVRDELERHAIRTLFHLAGQPGVAASQADPAGAFETNCRVTWCVLEACRLYGRLTEIVVASSNHVYGAQTATPFAEDAPLNGLGAYAASKACADLLARSYAQTCRLPVGVARITNTYGGHDHHKEHLVTATLLAVRRGEAPIIRSSGWSVKGYLYIGDTVEAFRVLAERLGELRLAGEAFNFAPDEPISVRDLVATILRVAGRDDLEPVVLGHDDGPPEREHLSNAKARRVLGWRPRYTLEAGIEAALRDVTEMLAGRPS
jgi:CDP-glucose 4,6-dehydratase